MSAPDRGLLYTTLCGEGHGELEDRRSVFLSHAAPVRTEEEALAFVKARQKEFSDATHNVWAFRLGADTVARYSDDGEPQGTAGIPVLDVLLKENLTDCAVVATRYFGGVLLGAGGLVRAYAKTAAESIRAAGRVDMRCCAAYEATVPYPLWGRVESILRTEALLENTAYAESIEVRLSVPLDREAALLKQLSDRTDGRVLPVKTGIVQRAFDAGLPELKE